MPGDGTTRRRAIGANAGGARALEWWRSGGAGLSAAREATAAVDNPTKTARLPSEQKFQHDYNEEWFRIRDMAEKIAPGNVPLMDSVRGLVRNVAWELYKAGFAEASRD